MEKVAGVILAGGAASRIGENKALLPFGGGTLLDAVIARAKLQVSELALSVAAGTADAYRSRYPNRPLLFDSIPDRVGPLAGVVAGMEWAQTLADVTWLATFPCDTPFLPLDLVTQLMTQARDMPVFAHDGEQLHGVCAVWPLRCLERLRQGIEEGGLRSLHSAMQALGGNTRRVQASEYAFFNINTRGDLTRACELARATE